LWERYAQTTHNFNKPSGSSIIITNCIHPLYGQSVVVRQIRKVGKLTKVIVEHPDGGLLSVPFDETNLEISEPSLKVSGTTPLFEPEKLLRLSQWLQGRSQAAETEKLSSAQKHQKVEQKKVDDTTAYKDGSSANRKRRMHQASGGADSTASGQNARDTATCQHSAQE
jgi:hypothetical protein